MIGQLIYAQKIINFQENHVNNANFDLLLKFGKILTNISASFAPAPHPRIALIQKNAPGGDRTRDLWLIRPKL
jgi:hypothetical protein